MSFWNFNIENTNEVISILAINEYTHKLERWQGPPHINKVEQYENVLSFKVSLFILFIQS